jgi:multidrug efflux pump subunit AcrA (membrane-fusion protein)
VDVNTIVMEIIDLKRLAISAEIPAATAGLKLGEDVQLLTGTPVESTISYISPVVNQSNDTVSVRALVPPDAGLRVGQFVSLRIVTATNADCLAAPEAAVVTGQTNHQPVLALVRGDEAQQTPVKIGLRENGLVEISSPDLHAGDTVVTVGAYGLPEHTKIVVQNPANEGVSTNSAEGQ